MKQNLLSVFVFTCLFTFASVPAFAQKTSASFEAWLEKYGAWDQLEKEYAREQGKDTPEAILKRAEVYLNLNSPKQALEVIEMTPSFADNATEAQRLWIGGQAQRALGDLSKSVLWFSQSSMFFTNESDMKRKFQSEDGLKNIWQDVWLKLYWSYLANHTVSRDSHRETLNRVLNIGKNVWGDAFWDRANLILNPPALAQTIASPEEKPQELGPDGLPLPPFISQTDMEAVVKSLAMTSLEKFDDARAIATSIRQEPVRFFWLAFIDFIQTGGQPTDLSLLENGNYLKAQAFWKGNMLAPFAGSRTDWVLGNPDSAPWTKFRNNMLSMPVDDAEKAIDKELGSMLISEETAGLLNSFKLALSMSNGNFIAGTSTWNKTQKQHLPLSLQLAGTLFFKEDLKGVLPENPSKSFTVYPILATLSGAAGRDLEMSETAPFWISAPANKLKALSSEYPMDKLLLLAYWQQQFDEKPSTELTKRSAFLFDDTAFGIDSILYLADQSIQSKQLQLGAFYLNRLDADTLDTRHKMAWLDGKLRLELDSGRNNIALDTYKEMNNLGVPIPIMTRLRMALLYQQNRDFETAREQLMIMWENRAAMSTTLQAETLFWLGEGEQAMRNSEKALDYYLRLAWQYPQENIWALTAMYRASLIYEKRGKYDTAKRLLTTVVKRADRKEQREAAKARIAAIDKKSGKQKSTSKSVLVYPF